MLLKKNFDVNFYTNTLTNPYFGGCDPIDSRALSNNENGNLFYCNNQRQWIPKDFNNIKMCKANDPRSLNADYECNYSTGEYQLKNPLNNFVKGTPEYIRAKYMYDEINKRSNTEFYWREKLEERKDKIDKLQEIIKEQSNRIGGNNGYVSKLDELNKMSGENIDRAIKRNLENIKRNEKRNLVTHFIKDIRKNNVKYKNTSNSDMLKKLEKNDNYKKLIEIINNAKTYDELMKNIYSDSSKKIYKTPEEIMNKNNNKFNGSIFNF
jgi:hypothetical protein